MTVHTHTHTHTHIHTHAYAHAHAQTLADVKQSVTEFIFCSAVHNRIRYYIFLPVLLMHAYC